MRNRILYGSVLLIGFSGIQPGFAQKKKSKTPQRPNVVFILADDLGYGDLSCYGQEKFDTPNIDLLAQNGMRFTQCYSGTTVSAPSRSCLLTGTHSGHTAIRGNKELNPEGQFPLPADSRTIFHLFKDAGYETGTFGKWGLGFVGSTGDPNKQGVDHFYGYNCQLLAHSYYPDHLWENDQRIELKDNVLEVEYGKGTYSQDLIHSKALSFLDNRKQEEPFFLYMGTQDVHVPRVPHPRFAGKSGLGTRGDVILQLDWTIGEIMNTLDSLQLTDNTILIFTSDNGPVIDDGYQDQAFERLNGHTPMGIYRGGKYSAYEAGTRIPFIVRWPAKVKPNKQQALFSQIDIFASLAALLKQPLPEGAAPDSQEHLNTLLGKDYTSREYIVQQNLNNTLAIVKGQWKYIEPSDAPAIEYWTKMELGNDRHPQLYDLSADPSEKNNVAKQHPEVVRELSELLESVKTR